MTITHILQVAALLLATAFAAVHAQTFGSPAADVGAGKKRAAACFACHGADGVSKIPGTPHLVGQQRVYLEKALQAYRAGQLRQDPTMTAMAKPLSDADIANIAAYFSLQSRMSSGQTAAQVIDAYERIKPVASVVLESAGTVAAAQPAGAKRAGDAVYAEACVACHGTGAAGAPKLGDKPAWAPRLAQGKDTLYQHALRGFNAMPPKGTCATCSDDDIRAAVDHLLAKAR